MQLQQTDRNPDAGYEVDSYCGPEHIENCNVRSEDQSEELAAHWLASSRADRVIVSESDSGVLVAVW